MRTAMPQSCKISKEMKTTLLTVFSYQEKQLQGMLSNPYFPSSIPFRNAMQFVLLLEHLLDSIGFPQRVMDLRSAFPLASADTLLIKQADMLTHSLLKGHSPVASFEIEIIFRQNASWQGSLTWIEENSVFSFRSALELLLLLDNILSNLTEA